MHWTALQGTALISSARCCDVLRQHRCKRGTGQASSFLLFLLNTMVAPVWSCQGLAKIGGCARKVSLCVRSGASEGNAQSQDRINRHLYCPGAQNIMKLADGLFIRCTREVSEK